jgi:hypothetical protein
MATWTKNGDTHTATINGLRLNVTKNKQFGDYSFSVSHEHRIRQVNNIKELKGAKMQAERLAVGSD